MKRFLAITRVYWQRTLTYRAVVFVYRLSDLIEMGMLLILWHAIYQTRDLVQGMTFNEMITYVLVGGLFWEMTRNFSNDEVDRAIETGRLSAFLVKPMSFFRYYLAMSLGRSMHAVLALSTRIIILFIASSYLTSSLTWQSGVAIAIMLILGFITELFTNFIVALSAFWTEETDPFHAAYRSLQRFLAGGYFPLSLLPVGLFTATLWLPFAYRFFVPMQIFLGRMTATEAIKGIAIQIGWILLLYGVIQIVWRKGLKKFEGTGR